MTPVNIPINANPAQVVSAVESIRVALRGVAQEGQAASAIDLKNLGTADLVKDLDRALENLRNLRRIGVGDTAAAFRKMHFGGVDDDALLHLREQADAYFPNPREADKFVRTVSSYALRGTSVDPANAPSPAPPPPPPPDPPEPPKPGAKKDSDDIFNTLKSGLMTGVGFFLAQAGLSSVAGVAGAAVRAGESENENTDSLLRRTGDLANSFEQLRKSADYFHKDLLVSRIDFERYSGIYGGAASVDAASAMRGARLAVGEATAFGADPGGFARGFGQAQFLGVNPEKFAEMIGESAVRGSMGGRVEEVMGALLHWTESASRISATGGALMGNVGAFADLYTSMQASGSPMFRGGNAVSVIDALNSSITAGGGGGLAGQVLTARALMGAGIRNPYAMQMQLAGGAFARTPGGGTNFDVISGELGREYGPLGADRAALAAGTLFGLNPLVARQLMGLRRQGLDLGGLDKTLAPFGGIAGINPDSLPDIIRARQATPDQLEAMRTHVRGNRNLSRANAAALDVASSPDALRAAIIAGLAQSGMPQTDQTRATEATNKMTDQLATLGGVLVNAITPLKQAMGDLAERAAPIAEWARQQLTPSAVNAEDGVVRYGNPQSMPGANSDWGSFNAGRVPVPQNVSPYSGMLTRIGQQESGLGTNAAAKGNIFGIVSGSWESDIKGLAATDPDVAKMISGMTSAQVDALRDLPHSDLQRRVAAYHLGKVRASLPYGASDMDVYAAWAMGGDGQGLMHAPDSAPLSTVLNKRTMDANPEYKSMTVGQWKQARRGLFPDAQSSTDAPAARVTVTPGAPLHIIIQDSKGRVHHETMMPIHTEHPTPHGTKDPGSQQYGPVWNPVDQAKNKAAARSASSPITSFIANGGSLQ